MTVASGSVRRYLVGRPEVQQIEVLAGQTLDELARLEKLAVQGEVLVSATAVFPDMTTAGERDGGGVVVCGLETAVSPDPWPELPPLPMAQTRRWLLEPTFYALQAGGSQFMAELRPANALFLQFWGVDYDGDAQAGQKLDRFVGWVQGVVAHYGGYILQLTTGDKGSYLYATFGALKAYEDDALRAVLAALDLHQLPQEMAFISRLQIGVTNGEMYVGAYGSGTRRTYGALGNKTNMAARLMVAADAGILCDQVVYGATKERITYEVLAPIQVKGRETLAQMGSTYSQVRSALSVCQWL
ncbi:MAG: adenylate/guanylate cyclase domain-containing protein [Ardenticatenaceae bacterium]|nr:adenylate/guanylate cyclase domain-containing protein [Ardenticatenaceae bacterium]